MVSSDSKKLIYNTKVFAIGNIVSKACQYVLITLCTYKLSTAEYGIADTIIQTATMFVPIFSLGIANAVFRFSMDNEYQKESIYTNALFVGFSGFIIALILYPVFCFFPFFQERIKYIYFLTVFEFLQNCTKEFVRGSGNTKAYMYGGIINASFQIIGCLVFVYLLNYRLFGYMAAIGIAYAVECFYYFFRFSLISSISLRIISKKAICTLLKYSVPLVPNTIMWWVIGASDRYFVLWIIGESATGLYAVAAKFPALITIITSIFFRAWEISAVEKRRDGEGEVFYNRIFNMLIGVMTVILGFLLVLIKPLIMIMVAPEFRSGWVYAPFLLLAASFSSFQTFLGVNYTVEKDSIGTLKSTSFAAILNLILNYFLIKSIGIQGATISTAISYLAVAIYRFYDTRKYVYTIVENKLRLAISYAMILLEVVMMALSSSFSWISIPICVIIMILNRGVIIQFMGYIATRLKN